MDIPEKKRLYCFKCRGWVWHSIRFSALRATCLSCGDERDTSLTELSTDPPELKPITHGGPEKRV